MDKIKLLFLSIHLHLINVAFSQSISLDSTKPLDARVNDPDIIGRYVESAGTYQIYIGGSVPSKRSVDLGMPVSAEAALTVQ